MRNTGIEYSSTERAPVVLPELASLLPPLTGEQLAALEADLLKTAVTPPSSSMRTLIVTRKPCQQAPFSILA